MEGCVLTTKDRIDRRIRLEKYFVLAIAFLLLIFFGRAVFLSVTTEVVSETFVNAELVNFSSDYDDGAFHASLRVDLDSGERITVTTRNRNIPAIGQEIVLKRKEWSDGRVTYRLPIIVLPEQ